MFIYTYRDTYTYLCVHMLVMEYVKTVEIKWKELHLDMK